VACRGGFLHTHIHRTQDSRKELTWIPLDHVEDAAGLQSGCKVLRRVFQLAQQADAVRQAL